MLSGAICGGIFASPPVSAILAAVRTCAANGGGPVLIIVKNYTGDRLNFGMAAEIARAEGADVATVVVADDAAIPPEKVGLAGSRGVAGAVFVHKCAGAAAEAGKSLEEVAAVAERVAGSVRTLGVSLENVDVPGASSGKSDLDADVMEVGLGIHGEPGRERSNYPHPRGIDGLVEDMLHSLYEYGYSDGVGGTSKWADGEEVTVLINNLGGCSVFEMGTVAEAVARKLESEGPWGEKLKASRIYVGSYMTSLDMHGFSVSVMVTDDELGNLLDAPTNAPAWTPAERAPPSGPRPSLTPITLPVAPATADAPDGGPLVDSRVRSAVRAACATLLALEPSLTEWDTATGDGDCGLTMSRGATEVLRRLDSGTLAADGMAASALFAGLADAVGSSMGGTSGVLFELFFRRASTAVREGDGGYAAALAAGVGAVELYGGARVGYRTMVDALRPAADAADNGKSAKDIAVTAETGAEGTAAIQRALAGRSNYIREGGLDGIPDPGAKAVAAILTAVAGAL